MKMKRFLQINVLCSVLLLSACISPINVSECANTNWQKLGIEAATQGRSYGLSDYYKDCSEKHHINPDLEAYKQGFELGRKEYCKLENAFAVGSANLRNDTTYCGQDWGLQYAEGMLLYDINSNISSKKSDIYNLEKDNSNQNIKIANANVDHPKNAKAIIASAQAQIDANNRKINLLHKEIRDLEIMAINQKSRGLDLLRQQLQAEKDKIHNNSVKTKEKKK